MMSFKKGSLQSSRRGRFVPMSWFFTIAIGLLILRMSPAQPQHFFKANAPVSKSLPRIGRRSDLETFPLLNPGPYGGPGRLTDPGDSSEAHFHPITVPKFPTAFADFLMWRKLMGEALSSSGSGGDGGSLSLNDQGPGSFPLPLPYSRTRDYSILYRGGRD